MHSRLSVNTYSPQFGMSGKIQQLTKKVKSHNTPEEIQEYLAKQKKKLTKSKISYRDLYQYDNQSLEGIQDGIKIFAGLSIKQIKLLTSRATEFVLQRGCHNMCLHCYADAKPPKFKPPQNYINQILFEDFQNLCDGFKELNKRFKFNVFARSRNDYNTLFHDADSSTIYLKDKSGKVYDYLDLSKMVHDVTDKEVLFDTTGWNIQDKKTQKRMEELVKKLCASEDYNFVQCNVSVNPFSPIYDISLKAKSANNLEKEKTFRELYTKRVANVLFTFSPLIEKNNAEEKLTIIARALPDTMENVNGYQVKDLNNLWNEILLRLKQMYISDATQKEPTIITDKNNIDKYLDFYKKQFNNYIGTDLSIVGRMKNIVPQKIMYSRDISSMDNGIIDINGNFYATNWDATCKTDIQLNYINKDKTTAKISP